MGGATLLSLDAAGRGVGEIRGQTAYGVRSRWGEARRMGEDAACWRGTGFTVCVRRIDEGPSSKAPESIFVGRCHMDACTWIDQTAPRLIGTGSPAVPGRRLETTVRVAQSDHSGGAYPPATPDRLVWSAPHPVEYFCSASRPAFRDGYGGWTVLPLPQVFGATESITRQYLRACHPETEPDPYEAPVLLGYTGGPPAQEVYPDFDALIRG